MSKWTLRGWYAGVIVANGFVEDPWLLNDFAVVVNLFAWICREIGWLLEDK